MRPRFPALSRTLSAPGHIPAARLRRFLTRHRRILAALACCAAIGCAVQALVPPETEHVVVVSASRDLPVGAVLDNTSLQTVRTPAGSVPPGAYDRAEDLLGRRLATPLLQGSPVTDVSLAGSGLLAGTPPGTVAIPLRPADPSVLDLLGPGQLVNVVTGADPAGVPEDAGRSSGAEVLATSVPVLWVSGTDTGGGWPATGGDGLVVVAAGRDNAARLTAASGAGSIYLVLTDE
ncbi:Flp pilus assembly protein CpaB [Arthrobacter sp. YD2]|uniref:Flp pilus assembly protein CpaB n=1 Tax=Arthrobacter sp. YD2 TaxID=3058046 RepID=UPI0025B55ADF|nr:Flp pilus assembly protein CpaB [Arthrobacter sp. YD2]MDN3903848.1 Flp pilus assembly protein CpaB [Arthrobacter sp. YD2]